METCTIKQYIQREKACDRIKAIDDLIDAMLLNMAESVDESGTVSMSMDDGQMKVVTEYRSVYQVEKGILALEKMKQRYIRILNGGTTVLRGRLNY